MWANMSKTTSVYLSHAYQGPWMLAFGPTVWSCQGCQSLKCHRELKKMIQAWQVQEDFIPASVSFTDTKTVFAAWYSNNASFFKRVILSSAHHQFTLSEFALSEFAPQAKLRQWISCRHFLTISWQLTSWFWSTTMDDFFSFWTWSVDLLTSIQQCTARTKVFWTFQHWDSSALFTVEHNGTLPAIQHYWFTWIP